MMACTAAGIRVGRAVPIPSTSVDTNTIAASTNNGRFSMRALTMVSMAVTAVGISSGSSSNTVVSTWVNSSVTVPNSMGRSSATASKIAPVTVGSADTIFSNTGVILAITAPKASTIFWVKFAMSASALPRPARKDSMDACIRPIEPVRVWVASRSKLPAYCCVCSRK